MANGRSVNENTMGWIFSLTESTFTYYTNTPDLEKQGVRSNRKVQGTAGSKGVEEQYVTMV